MDWSLTNKKLCVFVPNYQRGKYLHLTIGFLYEKNKDVDFCCVIGNDTHDPYVDSLCQKYPNCYSFTLDRIAVSRNGAFVRNYFVKRCQSEWILQKDPECLLIGKENWLEDFNHKSTNDFYRADQVCMVPLEQSKAIFEGEKPNLILENVDHNKHFHIHHCLVAPTKVLQDIGGYDEDFLYYGPEDLDMWLRLKSYGLEQHMLEVTSLHLYHERDTNFLNQNHRDMEVIMANKNPNTFIRNQGREWGQG